MSDLQKDKNEAMKRPTDTTIFQDVLVTPIGKLLLTATEKGLTAISFSAQSKSVELEKSIDGVHHPALKQAQDQLVDYFKGERRMFDLDLLPRGSSFQHLVWHEIAKIPYGETRSYKEIAAALGNSKKARAVGQAANRNPLPIVIPCHRVIGSSGKLTGYAGGLEIKTYLLNLEKII